MRFIDYNGSGGLDHQDIATSIAVEEATREDEPAEKSTPRQLSSNVGCATTAAFMALPILAILFAL